MQSCSCLWIPNIDQVLAPKALLLHVQVEYTVYKDETGQYVDEDHPQATALRQGPSMLHTSAAYKPLQSIDMCVVAQAR